METGSSENDTTVCDVLTSHEGKYTYNGGSLASACCTVGGLNDFSPDTTTFTLKSNNKTADALCCLTSGSKCSYSKIRCCNNERCETDHGRNVCTERALPSGTSVSLELERDACADSSKRFHAKLTVSERSQTFSGDVCCDTNKIHMINYA